VEAVAGPKIFLAGAAKGAFEGCIGFDGQPPSGWRFADVPNLEVELELAAAPKSLSKPAALKAASELVGMELAAAPKAAPNADRAGAAAPKGCAPNAEEAPKPVGAELAAAAKSVGMELAAVPKEEAEQDMLPAAAPVCSEALTPFTLAL
jgi:hypothetical protein